MTRLPPIPRRGLFIGAWFASAVMWSSGVARAQDVLRIKADNPPVWGLSAALIEEVSIGEVDGPQEYALGRIYQAAVAPDGGFYLYDDNDVQVRRYARFVG